MLRILLAALLCAAGRQDVRITLTDGTVIEGDLQGFEAGAYQLLVGGEIRRIAEADVLDVSLKGRPLPEAEPPPFPAVEGGGLEGALEKLAGAFEEGEKRRRELADTVSRAFAAHVSRLSETRDAAGIAAAFRRLPEGLNPEARRDVLVRLSGILAREAAAAPEDPVTAALSEGLAKLANPDAVSPGVKTALVDHFLAAAEREFRDRNAAAAVTFFQGALRLDPAREAAVRARAAEAMLPRARQLVEAGGLREAGEVVRKLLEIAPGHEAASALAEEVEFARLQKDLEGASASESRQLLREFLARPRRAEHREWALRAQTRPAARGEEDDPVVTAEMRKYFPVRPGRYLLYERADGKTRQKIRTDSATREGDVVRVYYTLEEIYKDFSTGRVYPLELERDAVILVTGREREPLLRFPLRAGDTWAWRTNQQEFRRTVKAVGETVEVGPAERRRRFEECVVVEFTSVADRAGAPSALASRSTYAPEVGLVKLEYLDPDHRKYGLELVDYGTE